MWKSEHSFVVCVIGGLVFALIVSTLRCASLQQQLDEQKALVEVSTKGNDYYKQRYFNLLAEMDFVMDEQRKEGDE